MRHGILIIAIALLAIGVIACVPAKEAAMTNVPAKSAGAMMQEHPEPHGSMMVNTAMMADSENDSMNRTEPMMTPNATSGSMMAKNTSLMMRG